MTTFQLLSKFNYVWEIQNSQEFPTAPCLDPYAFHPVAGLLYFVKFHFELCLHFLLGLPSGLFPSFSQKWFIHVPPTSSTVPRRWFYLWFLIHLRHTYGTQELTHALDRRFSYVRKFCNWPSVDVSETANHVFLTVFDRFYPRHTFLWKCHSVPGEKVAHVIPVQSC